MVVVKTFGQVGRNKPAPHCACPKFPNSVKLFILSTSSCVVADTKNWDMAGRGCSSLAAGAAWDPRKVFM